MAIRALPPNMVARIAAGEVIERPASVVKELIENALDAAAGKIQVELRSGGRRLIRVSDDGCGISAAELSLAFQRYTTSKAHSLRDLARLTTLGFRGEALASVAAVARVRAASRPADQPVGRYILIEGGAEVESGPLSAPKGTSVAVHDLFYNLPARRKFLKSPETEVRYVAHLLAQFALAWPRVQFTLSVDGRVALQTVGGRLLDVLAALYGPEAAAVMIPVAAPDDTCVAAAKQVRVRGYVSPPGLSRPNRHDLAVFVNGRLLASPLLRKAVQDAYHTLLPVGRYPVAALDVCVDPGELDVNVHPAKQDVKFLHERLVERSVRDAVAAGLTEHLAVRSFARGEGPSLPGMQRRLRLLERPGEWLSAPPRAVEPPPEAGRPFLRVLGQLSGSYIVAEGPAGLYVIDQHRAHERIIYERLLQQERAGAGQSQLLLEGLVLDLTPRQAALLGNRLPELAGAGLSLEPFGAHSFLVRAVPAVLRELPSPLELIEAALDEVLNEARVDWRDRLLATIACRTAVRAGQALSLAEMGDLVAQLERTRLPTTCPHANVVIAHLGNAQLRRQFGRDWRVGQHVWYNSSLRKRSARSTTLQKFDDIVNGGKASGTPFQVVLTEDELTTLANSYLGDHSGLPLSEAAVKLEPNLVTVVAKARFGGLPLKVEVAGTPLIASGGVRFELDRITLNGAPAPAFLANQLVETVNQRLGSDNLPLALETLELLAGQAMVAGRTK